jgi:hypothetical protein
MSAQSLGPAVVRLPLPLEVKAYLNAPGLALDPDLVVEARVVPVELKEAKAKPPPQPRRIGGEPRLG